MKREQWFIWIAAARRSATWRWLRTQLGESPMNNTATAIILAVGVVIAAGLVGGRYSVSPVLTFDGTANGVVVVDRFTGAVRYCLVSPPIEKCRFIPLTN